MKLAVGHRREPEGVGKRRQKKNRHSKGDRGPGKGCDEYSDYKCHYYEHYQHYVENHSELKHFKPLNRLFQPALSHNAKEVTTYKVKKGNSYA
jgi:hypothetical protein